MGARLWTTSLKGTAFPRLQGSLQAGTVIVGGGITGLMTAYLLARAGRKPVLLEKDGIGLGDTGSSTAMATLLPDQPISALRRRFGSANAAAVLATGQQAIDLLENVARKEGIECEFVRCPARVHASAPEDVAGLRKEAALVRDLGFSAAFREGGLPFERFGRLEVPAQAKFHPGKFLEGLAKSVIANGGRIFTGEPVTRFGGKHGLTAVTASGKVTARNVVVATHSPVDDRYEEPLRMKAFRTYAIAADVPSGTVPDGIYWDTHRPYRYFRVDKGAAHDRIVLGGGDHPTGTEPDGDPYAALTAHLATIIGAAESTITHRWSGQVFETADGLPFIGRSFVNPRHFVAAGFAGNGITFGSHAAALIAAEMLGQETPTAKLYSPKRVRALGRLATFGSAVFMHYVSDHLGLLRRRADLPQNGQGKLAIVGGKRVALSRGPGGRIVAVSAVCTHLGCLVHWNTLEKTWDCPCHGSRFQPTGEVETGPAREPLERLADVERKLSRK